LNTIRYQQAGQRLVLLLAECGIKMDKERLRYTFLVF
jgi:hypothetical protein